MLYGVVLSIQSRQLQHHAHGFTSLGSTLQRSGSLNTTCVQCVQNGIASSSSCSLHHSNIPTFQHIQHSCCSAQCVSYPFQHIQPCSNHRLAFQSELLMQQKFFCNCCACCGWCMPKVACLCKIKTPRSRSMFQ